MHKSLFVSIAVVLFASAPARSQVATTAAPPNVSQIITTGTGEAHVVPDRATIYLGVQSRAATAAAAGADNARRQKAILDTLRTLGLGSDQLSTINYSVSPEMQYNPNGGSPRVTGYVVNNTVRAQLRRIDDVGRAIDAALAKGANEISSLEFTSSKADSVRRAALAEAVTNARSDAEALARAAGGSLGSLIEISTANASIRPVMQVSAPMMAKAASPTPVEPGEQSVSASVTARWSFIPR
ncbi:MAG TPA: SIMPL domain-containing protein [Gemmatimonadaceae bacterium]|nr:SIMPL domain-containing protein [Gemmatimonadaceae bacterium]